MPKFSDDLEVLHPPPPPVPSQSAVQHPLRQVREGAGPQVPRILHRRWKGQPQGQHGHLRQNDISYWTSVGKTL